MSSAGPSWAAGLARIEDRLRARGLTGGQAFDALLPALEARLGGRGPGPDDELAAMVASLPHPGGDDVLGLAYERFFADLFKGRRGQFFTPPGIGRWLVHGLDPRAGEVVLDPTCGSGGLLLQAARPGVRLRGADLDPRLARLARVNLALAGVDATVVRADVFAAEPEPVDVVVANPPFSVAVDDPAVLARYALAEGKARVASDVLFAEALGRWVRPGGRAGIVMPWSFLANPGFEPARERLCADFHVERLAALPEGVFRPFGGAAGRACLLWLRRRGPGVVGRPPRFAALADPGYDVRSRHLRATSSAELEARIAGEGWSELPEGAWLPAAETEGVRVGDLCALATERVRRADLLAELADVDPGAAELAPRACEARGVRPLVRPGDVVVARLRPNLGNVAIAPEGEPCAGSPEWIVLRPHRHPRWLLHALRSPTWRRGLPVTRGQTRPRTTPEAVLDSRLRVPADEVATAVDRASTALARARRRTTLALRALQEAVDRHAAGEIGDDELRALAEGLAG